MSIFCHPLFSLSLSISSSISLSVYLSSCYLLIWTYHFLNKFEVMLHIEFYVSFGSVEIVLCAFPISLNISHRNKEEEDIPSKAGRERAPWINAGGRESIWCVGGSRNHAPCRLQGWGSGWGYSKIQSSRSPRSDVETEPARAASVKWGDAGNSVTVPTWGQPRVGSMIDLVMITPVNLPPQKCGKLDPTHASATLLFQKDPPANVQLFQVSIPDVWLISQALTGRIRWCWPLVNDQLESYVGT